MKVRSKEVKENVKNEVVERVTTVQEWLLRVESAKGPQVLNYNCFIFWFDARGREDLFKSVGITDVNVIVCLVNYVNIFYNKKSTLGAD